ncbi:hypothetical protein BJ138DRAFT_1119823, partial [Hygrophoropsis aurantiaca]
MSFLLASDGRLVRDLWPKGIGNLDGEHLSPASLEDWQKVPPTYAEICSWARIARDPTAQERRRENIIVYCQPPSTDSPTLFPISVRVQGILEACCLRPLGNWNGDAASAQRACHTLTLRSNGDTATWSPVLAAVQNIRQLIQRELRGNNIYQEPQMDLKSDLRLFHRVFEKRQGDGPVTVLSVADDLSQLYPAIAQQWDLADRVRIGRRTENGGRTACTHLTLSPGDFVDVGLTFEIVRQKDRNGATAFKVHLSFSHVLQVASVDVLKKQDITDKKRSRPPEMEVDQTQAKIQKT